MDIEIDDQNPLDQTAIQKVIGGNCNVVQEAKTLSTVKERMMGTTCKIHASAILQCIEGTLQGP
jgi:hypothetical protein